MFDVISMRDFSREQIIAILDAADDVKRAIHGTLERPQEQCAAEFREKCGRSLEELLSGLSVTFHFLEPSTRTHQSFEFAAEKCGACQLSGFQSKDFTSLVKGESWAENESMYAVFGVDAIVMRTTTEGIPRWSKEVLTENHRHMIASHRELGLPYAYRRPAIFNGGDGKHEHPTQCFLDLFTIRELARANGRGLDGLELALLNDLAHGRTNASLMSVAHLFGFKLHLAYPGRFGPPQYRRDLLKRQGVEVCDHEQDMMSALASAFAAYHSRPQKERVGKGEDLITIKKWGQINRARFNSLGDSAPYLMHPKPIDSETFEEIAPDMTYHPRNVTNLQASNGVYVRIALLALALERMHSDVDFSPLVKGEQREFKLEELTLSTRGKDLARQRSGYIRDEGLVIDHIPPDKGRRLFGMLGLEDKGRPYNISANLEVAGGRAPLKDVIKIHCPYELSSEQYRAVALIAPEATISYVRDGRVYLKLRSHIGDKLDAMIRCGNEACVTNVEKEHVPQLHHFVDRELGVVECAYCETEESLSEVYEDNRFIYVD